MINTNETNIEGKVLILGNSSKGRPSLADIVIKTDDGEKKVNYPISSDPNLKFHSSKLIGKSVRYRKVMQEGSDGFHNEWYLDVIEEGKVSERYTQMFDYTDLSI